jgi:hypothetical protein
MRRVLPFWASLESRTMKNSPIQRRCDRMCFVIAPVSSDVYNCS